MKKFTAFFMSIVMMLAFLPQYANAASVTFKEKEELYLLASEVFPEYADKILSKGRATFTANRSSAPRQVVTSISREVSATEIMTYTEYSDGVILLTDASYDKDLTVTNLDQSTMAAHYTMNIKATCSAGDYTCSGYFKLTGLSFSIIAQSNDFISSVGSTTYEPLCYKTNVPEFTPIMNETASQHARLEFYLTFRFTYYGPEFLASTLVFDLGGNAFNVSHNG